MRIRRSMLWVATVLAALFGATFAALTPPAGAVPITPFTYAQPYFQWSSMGGGRVVIATLTTAQATVGTTGGQWFPPVSYATGTLTLQTSGALAGSLQQLFSDRTTGSPLFNPFAADHADALGMQVSSSAATSTLTVTLTALSWGGGQQTLRDLHIQDGVLVGSGASVGNQTSSALFTISLGTFTRPT
jgi:hypothetical protein